MTDVFTYLWARRAIACGVAIEGKTLRPYIPPVDAKDRRRRVARWRRANPGQAFWRGAPLHADGSRLNEVELIQWRIGETERRMQEDLSGSLYSET